MTRKQSYQKKYRYNQNDHEIETSSPSIQRSESTSSVSDDLDNEENQISLKGLKNHNLRQKEVRRKKNKSSDLSFSKRSLVKFIFSGVAIFILGIISYICGKALLKVVESNHLSISGIEPVSTTLKIRTSTSGPTFKNRAFLNFCKEKRASKEAIAGFIGNRKVIYSNENEGLITRLLNNTFSSQELLKECADPDCNLRYSFLAQLSFECIFEEIKKNLCIRWCQAKPTLKKLCLDNEKLQDFTLGQNVSKDFFTLIEFTCIQRPGLGFFSSEASEEAKEFNKKVEDCPLSSAACKLIPQSIPYYIHHDKEGRRIFPWIIIKEAKCRHLAVENTPA